MSAARVMRGMNMNFLSAVRCDYPRTQNSITLFPMLTRSIAWWPVVGVAIGIVSSQAPAPTRDYPVQPVPFTAVKLTDAFWAPRIEINRTATIPVAFEQCERTNRVDLFVRA